jgi:ribosomal protein L22
METGFDEAVLREYEKRRKKAEEIRKMLHGLTYSEAMDVLGRVQNELSNYAVIQELMESN